MDDNSIWLRYVAMWTSGLTQQQIADRAGVSQGTISRWLTGTKLPTEGAKVAAFARGFGRNVLEAFVAARMLSLDEAMEGLPLKSWELLKQMHWDAADELMGPDEEEEPEDRRDYGIPVLDPDTFAPTNAVQLLADTNVLLAISALKSLHTDQLAGSGAFLIAALTYLQESGEPVPREVVAVRDQLAHGRDVDRDVLAAAETILMDAVNKMAHETESERRQIDELLEAARTIGRPSAGQLRRAQADLAGEPDANDGSHPDDYEPR